MAEDAPFAHGLVESLERRDGAEGKAVVDDEAKLFNGGKFGVGKPKAGNAPNGDKDGKPNGRPQGRSKNKKKKRCFLSNRKRMKEFFTVEGRVQFLLLFFCHRFFAIVTHRRCSS